METYLKNIKNKQIDSIQLSFLFFLAPLLLISLLRIFETGWQWLYFLQILLCLSAIILYIFRSRVSVSVKTHFCCILLLLACFSGAIRFSISGGFYLCLLSSVISVLVFGKRVGFIYLFISIIGLGIIGALHILKIIHTDLDFNSYNNNIYSWVMLIAAIIYLQTSIILSIGIVHQYFQENIDSLIQKSEDNDRLQAELKVSETQYRTLISTAVIPIIISNTQGDLLFVNESAEKLFNIKFSDLQEKNSTHFWQNINARNKLVHELDIQGNFQNKEVELFDQSHNKISVLSSSNLIKYNGQQAILTFLNDVTAEKQNQQLLFEKEKAEIAEQISRLFIEELTNTKEKLRKSEIKYRLIAENSLDGIFTLDSDKKINYVSPSYLKQLGYGIDEEIGIDIKTISERIHPDDLDEILSVIKRSDELKQQDFFMTFRAKTKTDEYIWREDHVYQEFDESGRYNGSYVICRDVTERKKSEALLKEYADNLKAMNGDLESFAYVASHDLKAPLNVISGFLGLLKSKKDTLSNESRDEYLKYIQNAVDHMKLLINDLLQFSRIGSNSDSFVQIDLNQLLISIKGVLAETILQNRATIKINQLPEILANKTLLNELFMNLLGNALKFHKSDKELIIEVGYSDTAEFHQFYVKDNGIGIAENNLDKLFIMFKRLNTQTEFQGTGIGLALCKRIVEAHKGRIWVESVLGEGSTFYFTIKK